ncbi:MAG: pur operon repressor [Firmicutes bacterium]|nr:pur operon repressor [Bacillota bacterium]
MEKLGRNERLIAITKELLEHPHRLISLSHFAQLFEAAKSTTSEDVAMVKSTFEALKLGRVETVPGAAGGVRFVPYLDEAAVENVVQRLCREMSDPRRILPGGFIYMADILFSPSLMADAGRVFATKFADLHPDYVLTMETKGIPLAFMTAAALNVPLAIARRDTMVAEGPVVSINYISGSTRRIQTMSLARRALTSGARVLIMDDFMKGGGTAKGLIELAAEFAAEVVGIGVLVVTSEPASKLVDGFVALLLLEGVDEEKKTVAISPA